MSNYILFVYISPLVCILCLFVCYVYFIMSICEASRKQLVADFVVFLTGVLQICCQKRKVYVPDVIIHSSYFSVLRSGWTVGGGGGGWDRSVSDPCVFGCVSKISLAVESRVPYCPGQINIFAPFHHDSIWTLKHGVHYKFANGR